MGDSVVEAKAGDGENVGYAGSEDEALREGRRRHLISLVFKSRLQKLVDRTDDKCVSSHIFTGRHVLIPIPSVDGLSLGKLSGLPKDTGVATTTKAAEPETPTLASIMTESDHPAKGRGRKKWQRSNQHQFGPLRRYRRL